MRATDRFFSKLFNRIDARINNDGILVILLVLALPFIIVSLTLEFFGFYKIFNNCLEGKFYQRLKSRFRRFKTYSPERNVLELIDSRVALWLPHTHWNRRVNLIGVKKNFLLAGDSLETPLIASVEFFQQLPHPQGYSHTLRLYNLGTIRNPRKKLVYSHTVPANQILGSTPLLYSAHYSALEEFFESQRNH